MMIVRGSRPDMRAAATAVIDVVVRLKTFHLPVRHCVLR